MAKVTLKNIAEKAGVSVALVSNYLNHNPSARMTEKTRKKIDSAVAELNYRGSAIARSLRTGKSNIIGYVIVNNRNAILHDEMLAVLDAASERNYQIFVNFSTGEADTLNSIDMLSDRGCDAFVISGVFDEKMTALICKKNYPLVILNSHPFASAPGKLIRYDYRRAVRECIEYLQKKGHSEIFFQNICGQIYDQRYLEFRDFFGDKKVWNITQPSFEAWLDFHRKHPECTAIIHSNDFRAMKTIQYCRRSGVRIPEDVAIVGFDNISAAECASPSLSSISKPLRKAASVAVQALIDQLQGKDYELPELLYCQFIPRESI